MVRFCYSLIATFAVTTGVACVAAALYFAVWVFMAMALGLFVTAMALMAYLNSANFRRWESKVEYRRAMQALRTR